MRIRRLILLPLLGLALVAAACGGDDEETAPAASAGAAAPAITGAWARATPDVAKQGAMYATITGAGAADAVVGVDVDAAVAGKTSLHETSAVAASTGMDGMEEGASSGMQMMEMTPVAEIPVPADGSVELKPGGLHVMLEELPAPLVAGSTFSATVRFKSGQTATVEVEVRDA